MLNRIIQIIGIGLGIALMALAPLAFAHDGGHGSKIEGKGPNGGSLAPVILAKDAELAAKAPTQAVAEWKRTGDSLEIRFWDAEQKKALEVPAASELKWIFLGKKLPKPVVLKRVTQSGSKLLEKFDASLLTSAEAVEIILPSLGAKTEKQVVALSF